MNEKAENEKFVPINEASNALKSIGRRLAIIHLSYARTIINELGEEKGMRIISKAIKDYGVKIGEKTKEEVMKQGLECSPENFSKGESFDLPTFPGTHERLEIIEDEGVTKYCGYGCLSAKVWKEYGEEKLGRLFCYVDPAKFMAYNPKYKLVHSKAIPDGDEYCELQVKPTTEKERKDFLSEDADWFYIDK